MRENTYVVRCFILLQIYLYKGKSNSQVQPLPPPPPKKKNEKNFLSLVCIQIRGVTDDFRFRIRSGQRIWRTRSEDLDGLFRRFFKRAAVYGSGSGDDLSLNQIQLPNNYAIKRVGSESFVSVPLLSRHLSLKARIRAQAGQPLRVTLRDRTDTFEGVGYSDCEMEVAKSKNTSSALSIENICEAVAAMGGTQYRLGIF